MTSMHANEGEEESVLDSALASFRRYALVSLLQDQKRKRTARTGLEDDATWMVAHARMKDLSSSRGVAAFPPVHSQRA